MSRPSAGLVASLVAPIFVGGPVSLRCPPDESQLCWLCDFSLEMFDKVSLDRRDQGGVARSTEQTHALLAVVPLEHRHLYRALYGLLTLLPQSAAFETLNGRLHSLVSGGGWGWAVGSLRVPGAGPSSSPRAPAATAASAALPLSSQGLWLTSTTMCISL